MGPSWPNERPQDKGDDVDPRPPVPTTDASASVPAPREPAGGGAFLDDDERRLHQLGYAQELRRNMSGFSNFAVSFTIISILSGCLTLYGYGMNTGGPVLITW